MGSDIRVVEAARVSTRGDQLEQEALRLMEKKDYVGLINFLMKNRHGSPFEHVVFTWRITSPIFVWREFMRHRIASYNEESGRYTQLKPVFYVPNELRPLIQQGKPGHYTFVHGTEEQTAWLVADIVEDCAYAYEKYERRLARGYAKEISRITLPLNIYSTAYVTMNARGLMNFLSLRTKDENSTFPSFPQYEIEQVARDMEKFFAEIAEETYNAWNSNGRVAP